MTFKNKVTTSSILTYFLLSVAFVVIRMLSAFGLFNFMGDAANYVFNIIVQIGLMLLASVFIFAALTKKKAKTIFTFYGYKKISPKSIALSVAIGACVFVLNIFIASFFGVIIQLFGYKYTQSPAITSYPFYMLLVNTLFTAILPAVGEETAHRGLLLRGLSNNGKMKAIIISSLLFGLLHMNIEQFFYATIIGIFVGYLAIICDSIFPAMIIHFMNNFLNVYFSFSSVNGLPLGRAYSWVISIISSNFLLGSLLVVSISALLVLAIITLVKKLRKDNNLYALKRIQNAVVKELIHSDYLYQIEKTHSELTGIPIQKKTEAELQEEDVMLDKKLGFVSEIDEQILADKSKSGLSILAKILLVATFVLLGGVTIFTFIWGVI